MTPVLLLDDDASGRLTLGALLEDAGFEVVEAASLAEARRAAATRQFALAILDVELPDGRGTELLAELAAQHPGIALAVLSGHETVSAPLAHLSLTKAAPPDALLSQLTAVLSGRRVPVARETP